MIEESSDVKKYHKGKEDIVFKIVFLDEKDKSMLEELLSRLLEKKVKVIKFLRNEIGKEYYNEKGQTLDFLAEVDKEIVHLELNGSNEEYYPRRNFSFFTNAYNKHIKRGEIYDLETKFIHISLSYGISDKLDIKEVYTINNCKSGEKYHEFIDKFEIIEYNMSKLKRYYEIGNKEIIDKYGYLIMLDLDKEELRKIKKDGFMEKYEKKVNRVNEDSKYAPLFTSEEEKRIEMNTIKYLGKKEGIEEGKKEGIKERNIEIAKNLIKQNIDKNIISKSTGLSIEEIKELSV